MDGGDLIPIGEAARRAGMAASTLRFYEREGLIRSKRTGGGQRRYARGVLRRLAFVQAAQNVGLTLEEIRSALATLPRERNPTVADWSRLSASWRARLDEQIEGLEALRDGLTSCIGCGCLSLRACRLMNRDDALASRGPGATRLPPALRRRGRASGAAPESAGGRPSDPPPAAGR